MIFSPEVIALKTARLDSIHSCQTLLYQVVADNIARPFLLKSLCRYWEPGGGASLYLVATDDLRYFLKVKHRSVCVESRLESESDFIRLPSLKNEVNILVGIDSPHVPRMVFYEEREDHSFLALEYLETFDAAVVRMDASQLLAAWEALEQFVRQLYASGIVHTDIHEGNICFRNNEIVLCDFEEARVLDQNLPFEESLDYCGVNRYGNVGEFPVETGRGIGGFTCLQRLREVFKNLIRKKLSSFLSECHFDQSCPFNLDELQEEDLRIYQSVNIGGISIAGQRPMRDSRQNIVRYFLFRQWRRENKSIRHLDIGCNLGTFNFLAAEQPYVGASTGLEAFSRYIDAANCLRFLTDAWKTRFRHFVCGESHFEDIGYMGVELCSMFSVYHHISSRVEFLSAIARYRPGILLAEFATQERYYPERGSVEAEIEFIRQQLGYRYAVTLMNSLDYGRPVVLFGDERPTFTDRVFILLSRSRCFAAAMTALQFATRPRSKYDDVRKSKAGP